MSQKRHAPGGTHFCLLRRAEILPPWPLLRLADFCGAPRWALAKTGARRQALLRSFAPLSACGAAGCWERYASTSALVRRAVRTDPALDSGRAIFAAARQGDKAVLALLEGWIAEIAEGLAGLVHLFNPQLILIGGGVSSQQELLIDPLARQVKARVMPAFAEGLELRPAALANDAGLVGAVRYFLDRRA